MDEASPDIIKQLRVIFYQKRPFFIIPFFIFTPLLFTAGTFIPKAYRSSTTILVDKQKIPKDYIKPTVTIDVEDRLRTITQQIMSPSRLRKVLYSLDLVPDEADQSLLNRFVLIMQNNIKIDVSGQESFRITFSGRNPKTVMKIANKVASLFIEENLKLSEQQAQSTTEFLSSELAKIESQLRAQEERSRIFKQKYMGELPNQLESNLRALDRLQIELQSTLQMIKDSLYQKILLEQQISAEQKRISTDAKFMEKENPLDVQLKDLNAQLAEARPRYSEDWPAIKRLKIKIAELKAQLKAKTVEDGKKKTDVVVSSPVLKTLKLNLNSVKRRISDLEDKEKKLIKEIDDYKRRVDSAPKREGELIDIGRDYGMLKDTYKSLLDKKLEAKLSESLEKKQKGENFIILDPAEIPLAPYFPIFYQIILGSIGGGIALSILLVYASMLLDRSYNDLDEVEISLGLPLIGAIPKIRTKSGQRKKLLRQVLATILIIVYMGIMGLIILNKTQVRQRLYDWKIIQPAQLI